MQNTKKTNLQLPHTQSTQTTPNNQHQWDSHPGGADQSWGRFFLTQTNTHTHTHTHTPHTHTHTQPRHIKEPTDTGEKTMKGTHQSGDGPKE